MSKKDVRSESLLKWDEYKDKPLDVAVQAIYSHAEHYSKTTCTWYWRSIKSKRLASLVSRGMLFVLVVFGTMLPILAGLGDKTEVKLLCTMIGIAALAFAGLLKLADQVFGWSSGWLRYIATVTAMENSTRTFELDWGSYVVDKGGKIADTDAKSLFEIAKRHEENIAKMQSDETDKWIAEFNSGLALLGELIKSQREAGERNAESIKTTVEAQRKAAQENEKAKINGSVEVTILQSANPVPLSIAIDDEQPTKCDGSSWARTGVKPGHHKISLTTATTPPRTLEKIITVPTGEVGRVEFRLS